MYSVLGKRIPKFADYTNYLHFLGAAMMFVLMPCLTNRFFGITPANIDRLYRYCGDRLNIYFIFFHGRNNSQQRRLLSLCLRLPLYYRFSYWEKISANTLCNDLYSVWLYMTILSKKSVRTLMLNCLIFIWENDVKGRNKVECMNNEENSDSLRASCFRIKIKI